MPRRRVLCLLLFSLGMCAIAVGGIIRVNSVNVPVSTVGTVDVVGMHAASSAPVAERPLVGRDVLTQLAATPLHFERNDGQAPGQVKFVARGAGYGVFLTETESAIVLSSTRGIGDDRRNARTAVVRSTLVGASTPAEVVGESTLAGTVNYYHGNDPARWQHDVPTYARVRARGVYAGIDAVYYGNQRQLQYDFEVAPGADPARIELAFEGIDAMEVDEAGDLVLRVDGQELRQKKPYSYQDSPHGRQEVESRFVLVAEHHVGFEVGPYDATRPLVIDPVLTYSSFFGGDSEEVAYDVALGPGGTVYVTGITADLAQFPTVNAFQPSSGSQPDAFITKFQPNGLSLSIAFSSYLGGNDQENTAGFGYTGDIAVDAAGNAYLTGSTRSSTFPVTAGAQDTTYGANNVPDAFYAKVSNTGQLLYATYLGGIDADVGSGIALGPGGVVYIFGYTASDHVTEQSPVTANAYDQELGGGSDAFVARYTAAGVLDYFTFLGGNGGESTFYIGAIAVDAAGLVYVATDTSSSVSFLPANGFDTTLGTLSNAGFIVKLDTSLVGAAQLLYSSYISGTNGQVWAMGLAVTSTGIAYVVGETSTTSGFPLANALQGTYVGGNRDAYVMKVDTTKTGASSLSYSTYLGGDQSDTAYDVAVDALGRAVVVGTTFSTGTPVVTKFPLVQQVASCPTFVRLSPFVTVFNAAGTAIEFSTCYASSYSFYGVAVGAGGEIWAVGATNDATTNPPTSTGVPVVNAEQGTYGGSFPGTGGDYDALIVRISPSADLTLTKIGAPNPVLPGGTLTYTMILSNASGEAAANVVVTDNLPVSLTFTSCAATNGGVCGGSGNNRTISYPSLAAGAISTITLVASVSQSLGAAATISNTATVASATPDPNLANNSATSQVSTPTLTPTGDADNDGLSNDFETRYGLNPFSGGAGNGANDDPDGDGKTNLQEQIEGTHPRGFVITYLAEGATGAFFDTRIAIANPTGVPALVLSRFQRGDGVTVPHYQVVPPMSRATIDVEGLSGLESAEFATLVEADVQVVVDRTMTWDDQQYGSHAERGILTRTATEWYFAEGATIAGFSLFYLIQNPNDQAAHVEVTYLLPAPNAPLVRTYTVGPKSRFNIWVNNEGATVPGFSQLQAAEVSAVIRSTNSVPIIAERAMYLNRPGQVFGAGHESAGVTSPASTWFLAEGATGPFFDMFILVANPNTGTASIRADFLLPTGQVVTKNYAVAGRSRFNIWVDFADAALADTAVSTTITSTNGVPIIAERAMWWPGSAATWYEAHNSPGETTTGVKWAMAEGEVGGPFDIDTFILLANTSATAGTAKVTLIFEDGTPPVSKNVSIPPRSRTNITPRIDFPVSVGKRFGVIVESIGTTPAQIIVERAMYSDAGGVNWAAGTNALATKLQ